MRESNRRNKGEKKNEKTQSVITQESIFAVGALFCAAAFFCLLTDSLIFGTIGEAIHDFLMGVFGYSAYVVFAAGTYVFGTALFDVRFIKNRKAAAFIALSAIFLALVLHTAFTYGWSQDGYLSACYASGKSFPKTTVTGVVGGSVVFLLQVLTTKIGAIIIFSLFTVFFGYLSVLSLKGTKFAKAVTKKERPIKAKKTLKPVAQSTKPTLVQPPIEEVATTQMTQRPNVHLPETGYAQPPQGQGGYSPFVPPRQNTPYPQATQTPSYGVKKQYKGQVSPAELLKGNLIFDKSAKVNNRTQTEPTPSYSQGASSYLGDYADYVNGGGSKSAKPPKVVADTYDTPAQTSAPTESWRLDDVSSPISPAREMQTEEPTFTERTLSFPTEEMDRYFRDDSALFPERDRGASLFDSSIRQDDASRDRFLDEGERRNATDYSADGRRDSLFDATDRVSDRTQPAFPDFGRDRVSDFQETLRTDYDREEGYTPTDRDASTIFDDDESVQTPSTFEERGSSLNFDEPTSVDRGNTVGFGRGEELPAEDSRIQPDFTPSRDTELDFSDRTSWQDEVVPPVSQPIIEEPAPIAEPPKPEPPKSRVIKPYVRVPDEYFDCRDVVPDSNVEEVQYIKNTIIETLTELKISNTSIGSVTFGPTVTRYNVIIPRNIPPKKVVSLDQSIAISLQAKEGVNIYPNFEDGAVSIEVPNKKRQFVRLGCMLTGEEFIHAKPSTLTFAMGKDVANRKVYGDICKMTHLLVAGASNSGKSVFLGSLIISLIAKYSPEELRLILIDPKKTEFVIYQNLPHLIINEIITDVQKTIRCLDWTIREMERRYKLFQDMSMSGTYVVNADEYNAHVENVEDKLPKIVVIVDELADLMLAAKKEIEDRIQNLTQKARAAGIHLILATQRPSTDVITGVIKSNLPTRIAFAVASEVDSRVILDQTGAHKLLGKGDFLYTMPGINTPVRVQSAYCTSEESQSVVTFIKVNNDAYYDEKATAFINCTREPGDDSLDDAEEIVEPVYIEALRQFVLRESASISMIQRTCGVGYNKAGKIVEWMETMGYISKFDGAKARKVLITKAQYEEKYGKLE